jgi:protein-disulfide isomerase
MRVVIAVVAVLLASSQAAEARKSFDPAAVYQVPVDDAPRHGPADAPITIVEFSDYACRYCNKVLRTLEHIQRLHGDKIRWVYRHLPLDDDETLAAEAGLAAGAQGSFWPMHDRLFAIHGQVDRASVELIAADLGLDMTRFRGDLDGQVHRAAVLADQDLAVSLGVSGTPTFFVNGRPLRGNQPLGVFLRVIDEELARAEEASKAGVAGKDLYAHLIARGQAKAASDAEEEYGAPVLDPTRVYRVGLGLDGHATAGDAPLVTIVEWSDFQCPYCASNAPNLARLRREYGDKVRLVFRHLPLPGHPDAQLASEAAVAAAAQGKFWEFHDRLFTGTRDDLGRAVLETIGEEIGLDMTDFRAALDERRHRDAVADDAAAAAALGIYGTPTLFINGVPIEGAPKWEHLKMLVDIRLDEAESIVAGGIDRADVYGMIMSAADGAETGDPSRMPKTASGARLELRQLEREQAVEAACRTRDGKRAGDLAEKLKGDGRDDARATCEAYGIDLP